MTLSPDRAEYLKQVEHAGTALTRVIDGYVLLPRMVRAVAGAWIGKVLRYIRREVEELQRHDDETRRAA